MNIADEKSENLLFEMGGGDADERCEFFAFLSGIFSPLPT